jgi:hypothetical protein
MRDVAIFAALAALLLVLALRRRATNGPEASNPALVALVGLGGMGFGLALCVAFAALFGDRCDHHDVDLLRTGRHVGSWVYAGTDRRIDRYWKGLRRFEIRPDQEGASSGRARLVVDGDSHPCEVVGIPFETMPAFHDPALVLDERPPGLAAGLTPRIRMSVQYCVGSRARADTLHLVFETEDQGPLGVSLPFERR